MKLGITFCLLICSACSYGDVPDLIVDAGSDGPPIHNPPSGLCCQVEADFTDDPYWQNGRYICDNDGSITGVGTPNVAWLCNTEKDGTCAACNSCHDVACVVGSTCLGFNGTGIVIPCDQKDW